MGDGTASFDLVERPWIRVRRKDRTVGELSLVETFRQANDLTGLLGDVPTQVFALTRLLLAILHRAIDGPRDLDHWEELWTVGRLPVGAIEEYLDLHRVRFDLLHPRKPFLQVADLHTAKGEMTELGRLIADVPNGRPFFTTRLGPQRPMSFAEAARWLVHCHAFDPSGIKSGAVGDGRVKGGKGYPIGTGWSGYLGGVMPEGATLRETLLLNLIPVGYRDGDQSGDLPVWERPPLGAAEEIEGGREPRGPLDLFTWPSRRIRLAHDGTHATGVLISNGDRITPQNRQRWEPHTAWRRSQAQEKKLCEPTVYMPKEHDPSRAVWRGLASLLPGAPLPAGKDAAPTLPPTVLSWIGHVTGEGVVEPDRVIQLRVVGMTYGSQSSTTEEIVDDAVALRSVLLRQDAAALAATVVDCVSSAAEAARALGSLAGRVARASGASADESVGPRERAAEQAYAELDVLFRTWLMELTSETDPMGAREHWHRIAHRAVGALARDLLSLASPSAWVGREVDKRLLTSSVAQRLFHQDLRKALPLAYPSRQQDTLPESEVTA